MYERARAYAAVSRRTRFEELVDRHEPKLRGVVFAIVRDADRVDDVLQDAFVRAYRKLPSSFESPRQEAAWLYRVVYTTCLNELRSRRRRRESPGLPEPIGVGDDDRSALLALDALAPAERAVVLLVDLIGLDYETAAAVLDVPRGTLAWRLSVARGKLREALDA